MIVLDTHVAVWWTTEPARLGAKAAAAIAATDKIGIPAIVYWEVSLLVRKDRLELEIPASQWAELVQRIPRVESIPLTAEIALLADSLDMHADPADRFIVATARSHGAAVLTKDRLIRRQRIVKTIW
jgi:PIN domain nuclease of toxin-antitoxin system